MTGAERAGGSSAVGRRSQAALDRFAAARRTTLDLTAALSQERLDAAPEGGGWSIGEVLDHLLRAEAVNRGELEELLRLAALGRRPYLRRELSPEGLAPAFVPPGLVPLLSLPASVLSALAPPALRELMVRTRLFPARASAAMRPRRGRPGEELRAELARSLAETRALVIGHPQLDDPRMAVHHPFLGTNDVPQILRLLAAHEERHQDQLRELLRGLDRAAG